MGRLNKRSPEQAKLVFASKVTGDLARPDVMIGFGGKIKAVGAGFAYYADAAGSKLACTIKGEHRWNSTTASWNFGESAKKPGDDREPRGYQDRL